MEKLCKFGGIPLATREYIGKVIDVMVADKRRRYLVPSAPGKKDRADIKMTDHAIACSGIYKGIIDSPPAQEIKKRIYEIIPDFPNLASELSLNLDKRISDIRNPGYVDSVKAFGEYASGMIISSILNKNGIKAKFLDPIDLGFKIVGRGEKAKPDVKCYDKMGRKLKEITGNSQIYVLGCYYGINRLGNIVTLPRSGNDTAAAVYSNVLNVAVYENYTNEDGLRVADPTVVASPRRIDKITHKEVRELSYTKFKLTTDCILPLIEKGIPIHVLNIDNPLGEGTWVVKDREVSSEEHIIGIAMKKGFVSMDIFKWFLADEVGFGADLFNVLKNRRIPYEHSPTGVDTISIILDNNYVKTDRKRRNLEEKIKENCGPLELKFANSLALVGVAGLGMKNHYDTHARIFSALAKAKIRVRTIDEGAEDLSTFIGVDDSSSEDAVRAVYDEFFVKK